MTDTDPPSTSPPQRPTTRRSGPTVFPSELRKLAADAHCYTDVLGWADDGTPAYKLHQGRDVLDRWQIIRGYLPDDGTLLDVGSHAGQFGIAAAVAKNATVVSIEPSSRLSLLQRRLGEYQGLPEDRFRVIGATFEEYASSVEDEKRWDLGLGLAMLHLVETDVFLGWMLDRCRRVLVEVPRPDETECVYAESWTVPHSPFDDWFVRNVPDRGIELVGSTPSPSNPERDRDLWLLS